MDNTSDNKINKKKLLLWGFIKFLECELMGTFVLLFYWAVSVSFGTFANILFGFVGITTVVCVMADYGLKQGDKARNKVTLHGAEPCRNFGLAIGVVAMLPLYIALFFLVLSRLGIIGNFLPAFKLINTFFFPIIDLAAHDPNIENMNPAAFILFAAEPLIFPITTWISFKWGYDQIDPADKIIYKSQKSDKK